MMGYYEEYEEYMRVNMILLVLLLPCSNTLLKMRYECAGKKSVCSTVQQGMSRSTLNVSIVPTEFLCSNNRV